MGMMHVGPKHLAKKSLASLVDISAYESRIAELESALYTAEQTITIQEVVKEVSVPVIIEKEVIKYIEIEVEKLVHTTVEVIKEISVPFEVVVEKFIEKIIEQPAQVVYQTVEKEIMKIPMWIYGAMAVETLALIVSLLK